VVTEDNSHKRFTSETDSQKKPFLSRSGSFVQGSHGKVVCSVPVGCSLKNYFSEQGPGPHVLEAGRFIMTVICRQRNRIENVLEDSELGETE
jgi:hypothetical protein